MQIMDRQSHRVHQQRQHGEQRHQMTDGEQKRAEEIRQPGADHALHVFGIAVDLGTGDAVSAQHAEPAEPFELLQPEEHGAAKALDHVGLEDAEDKNDPHDHRQDPHVKEHALDQHAAGRQLRHRQKSYRRRDAQQKGAEQRTDQRNGDARADRHARLVQHVDLEGAAADRHGRQRAAEIVQPGQHQPADKTDPVAHGPRRQAKTRSVAAPGQKDHHQHVQDVDLPHVHKRVKRVLVHAHTDDQSADAQRQEQKDRQTFSQTHFLSSPGVSESLASSDSNQS